MREREQVKTTKRIHKTLMPVQYIVCIIGYDRNELTHIRFGREYRIATAHIILTTWLMCIEWYVWKTKQLLSDCFCIIFYGFALNKFSSFSSFFPFFNLYTLLRNSYFVCWIWFLTFLVVFDFVHFHPTPPIHSF